jgi:dTDP-4-dehydrorhamnose 3,5-epimerase
MQIENTSLADARLISTERHVDERGYFARAMCAKEFAAHGVIAEFVQSNLSFNLAAGTFRGVHYQTSPSREAKLVRCVAGAIDDVIVDLRPDSPTFMQHEWFSLTADNLLALFVPSGFAHGFLTSTDKVTVHYEMADYYAPELARGVRWDDPMLKLRLPGKIRMISSRDEDYPDLNVDDLQCLVGLRSHNHG